MVSFLISQWVYPRCPYNRLNCTIVFINIYISLLFNYL